MIVKIKRKKVDYPDLSPKQPYFVIGIEADDYRLINDMGQPYLYPADLFEVVDSSEPANWITEYGEEGERYSYPASLKERGFFEDYFDGKAEAFSRFWQTINTRLSKAA
ncbi:MAG TPA: hypothetical protein DCG57_21850 [Candidatus Riflebacteria bacterium]|jgi:hypothetical protein|nr:hypothetical protein [Candidatus Riflebacteria bacterium]